MAWRPPRAKVPASGSHAALNSSGQSAPAACLIPKGQHVRATAATTPRDHRRTPSTARLRLRGNRPENVLKKSPPTATISTRATNGMKAKGTLTHVGPLLTARPCGLPRALSAWVGSTRPSGTQGELQAGQMALGTQLRGPLSPGPGNHWRLRQGPEISSLQRSPYTFLFFL